MSEQPHTGRDAAESDDQRVCQFPVAYDAESGTYAVAGHPIPTAGRPGRPSDYCGDECVDPDGVLRRHVRTAAFQRRQELKLASIGAAPEPTRTPARPVTSSRASLSTLLAQLEMVTTAHRDQLTSLVDRVVTVVSTASDPDAAVAEVSARRRELDEELRAAQVAVEEAEAETIAARRELARALEDKQLAEGAAADAIAERDERVTEANTTAEEATETATRATAELARIRTETAEQVAAAQQHAREQVEEARAEARRRIDEAERAAQARIDQVEHDAAVQITEATDDRDAANVARHRAEAEQRAAEQAAEDARVDSDRLRGELVAEREQRRDDVEQLRNQLADAVADAKARAKEDKAEIAGLRKELAQVRTEFRAEREQLRSDHAEETARLLAAADKRAEALSAALEAARTRPAGEERTK